MNSRFVKILSIAMLSAFLTGCMWDGSQDNSAEDYNEKSVDDYSKASADMEYAKQQFNQGNYLNAVEGVFNAVKNYVSSTVNEILGYMTKSSGTFVIDEARMAGHKNLREVAKLFADKSTKMAIDYYDGGKAIPLGQMVLKYPSIVGASQNQNPAIIQRLVSTVQLHEATNYDGKAQLSLLCNTDSTVDFGIGQVNTRSWLPPYGSCKGMVDENIVRTATNICADYNSHKQDYYAKYGKVVNGKLRFNINSFIVELLVRNHGGEANLVRDEKSPFNPIVNSKCTYRHLRADFDTVTRIYKCEVREWTGRFRCSKNSEGSDYIALTLMQYGGLKKEMLRRNIRLGRPGAVQQTFDDYMAEFRAAYSALYKEPPPF
jgi:hypothetical protein